MINEFLDDLPQRLKAARVAVLAIDHQYLFRSLIAQRIGEEKTKNGFDGFSTAYTQQLENFREAGIPIIHVSFSRADFPTYAHLPSRHRDYVLKHCTPFYQNTADLTVRPTEQFPRFARNFERPVNTDILHPIFPGDRVFEKQHVSAFHDGMLDVALRHAKIDTLIVTGLYAEECVDETLCDAKPLGYDCAVPTDMVFSAEKLIDLEENKRLVTAFFKSRDIPVPFATANRFHTACTHPARIFALS